MGRYELTDEQYALIEPELPTNDGKIGHPFDPHLPIINGIFWRLHSGAAWPDIPERYGKWKTIYDRYTTWRRNGTWDRILKALQAKLDAQGNIDWDQWSLDGTIVRAHRVAAGARKKGGLMARPNQATMHSAALSVGSAPKSTSSLTATLSRSMPASPQGRRMSRPKSKP
jgi:transposase